MADLIPIEVGQVWKSPQSVVRITRITPDFVYYSFLRPAHYSPDRISIDSFDRWREEGHAQLITSHGFPPRGL